MTTTSDVSTYEDTLELVLDRPTCLELLDRAGAASLACTVKALPSVVPVTVRVVSSTILLAVGRAFEAERLSGQIVAIGAGMPATPKASGWWVIVRGELHHEPGSARVLLLDPFEIEGRALPVDPQRRWWRC